MGAWAHIAPMVDLCCGEFAPTRWAIKRLLGVGAKYSTRVRCASYFMAVLANSLFWRPFLAKFSFTILRILKNRLKVSLLLSNNMKTKC